MVIYGRAGSGQLLPPEPKKVPICSAACIALNSAVGEELQLGFGGPKVAASGKWFRAALT